MSFFAGLGKRSKSAGELCKAVAELLELVEAGGSAKKSAEKAAAELQDVVSAMKGLLYGTPDAPAADDAAMDLLREMIDQGTGALLLRKLHVLPFESRTHVANIVNNLLRRTLPDRGGAAPFVEALLATPDVVVSLIGRYEDAELALVSGLMLREMAKHERLCRVLLESDAFWTLFAFAQASSFDVSSDAFTTFRELLVTHLSIGPAWLEANYEKFFVEHFPKMLESENYVLRRMSLKLLGEIMVEKPWLAVTIRFVSSKANLMTVMTLLRSEQKSIRLEAFHVFKVFVAYPNKSDEVKEILLRNKTRLIEFLTAFHNDCEDDTFLSEKNSE